MIQCVRACVRVGRIASHVSLRSVACEETALRSLERAVLMIRVNGKACVLSGPRLGAGWRPYCCLPMGGGEVQKKNLPVTSCPLGGGGSVTQASQSKMAYMNGFWPSFQERRL